jgi:hypothetical protein
VLTIVIPETEEFDPVTSTFTIEKKEVLSLEHSLVSLSKWESKWKKPFLSGQDKTLEETIDYIRCMTISSNVSPEAYYALTRRDVKLIESYMNDPMTATTISNNKVKNNRDIITSELIYYWMTELGIPFQPCEKWHINRLLMLIEVCSLKRQKPKNMSPAAIARQNHALNAARRAKHHSRG